VKGRKNKEEDELQKSLFCCTNPHEHLLEISAFFYLLMKKKFTFVTNQVLLIHCQNLFFDINTQIYGKFNFL